MIFAAGFPNIPEAGQYPPYLLNGCNPGPRSILARPPTNPIQVWQREQNFSGSRASEDLCKFYFFDVSAHIQRGLKPKYLLTNLP